MSKPNKGGSRTSNTDRKCGKAWKKHKRTGQEGANGKTVGGYTPAKIAERAARRAK